MCCQTAAQAYLCGEERKVELKECEMWAVLRVSFSARQIKRVPKLQLPIRRIPHLSAIGTP